MNIYNELEFKIIIQINFNHPKDVINHDKAIVCVCVCVCVYIYIKCALSFNKYMFCQH